MSFAARHIRYTLLTCELQASLDVDVMDDIKYRLQQVGQSRRQAPMNWRFVRNILTSSDFPCVLSGRESTQSEHKIKKRRRIKTIRAAHARLSSSPKLMSETYGSTQIMAMLLAQFGAASRPIPKAKISPGLHVAQVSVLIDFNLLMIRIFFWI